MWILARDWHAERIVSDKWPESSEGQNQYQAAAKLPGPTPEALTIQGNWKEAIGKLISKECPEAAGVNQKNTGATDEAHMTDKMETLLIA